MPECPQIRVKHTMDMRTTLPSEQSTFLPFHRYPTSKRNLILELRLISSLLPTTRVPWVKPKIKPNPHLWRAVLKLRDFHGHHCSHSVFSKFRKAKGEPTASTSYTAVYLCICLKLPKYCSNLMFVCKNWLSTGVSFSLFTYFSAASYSSNAEKPPRPACAFPVWAATVHKF